jgi:hypothetical protein
MVIYGGHKVTVTDFASRNSAVPVRTIPQNEMYPHFIHIQCTLYNLSNFLSAT